jgi:hypothetical protein
MSPETIAEAAVSSEIFTFAMRLNPYRKNDFRHSQKLAWRK